MSAKSQAGKARWAAGAATYHEDLAGRITDRVTGEAEASMDAWAARGRIPTRARMMARLAGRPLHLPDEDDRQ